MALIRKNDIDLSMTIYPLTIYLKGNKVLTINCIMENIMDFTDWMAKNPANNTYKKEVKNKFENKFYTFEDLKRKCSVVVNTSEIKFMDIPYLEEYKDDKDYYKCQILEIRK